MVWSRLFRIAARVAATQLRRELTWWQDCCKAPPPEEAPKYWRQDIPDRIYQEIWKDKRATTIQWGKPNLDNEFEEFQRTAKELELNAEDLVKKAASNGYVSELTDDVWSRLQNTDSWRIDSMEEAEVLAAGYGKDLHSIVEGISKGSSIPAPIVFLPTNGAPYLVAGNTRLMAARVLGERPQVFYFDSSGSSSKQEAAQSPVMTAR